MRLPRFRFTLGQLLKLIALIAVLLAALRTPLWPIAPASGIILAGFAIERHRGGPGIYGAMIAGVLGFPTSVLIIYLAVRLVIGWFTRRWSLSDLLMLPVGMFASGVVGGAWGAVLGYWAWMIVNFFSRMAGPRTTPEYRRASEQ